jgi:predicted nucleic acid-binding protein
MCGNADDGLELALGAPGLPAPHDSRNIAERGLFEIAISVSEHWVHIERLFTKYANRRISLADASVIRCAEVHEEARIATFDRDFTLYKWGRTKTFEIL